MADYYQVIAKDANAALGGTGLRSQPARGDRTIIDLREQIELNGGLQSDRPLEGKEFAEKESGVGLRNLSLFAHVRLASNSASLAYATGRKVNNHNRCGQAGAQQQSSSLHRIVR